MSKLAEEQKLLGDLKLIKQLGQGTLGTTYAAEHRFTRKLYAVKVLPEEFAQDRAFIQRFEDEIAALAAMDHPNIVKIHNVSFAQGVYFLVTDCIVDTTFESTNLLQYYLSKEGKLTQEEILFILEQIVDALEYGYSTNIQKKKKGHFGIKLSNILVRSATEKNKPQVLLSDWGLTSIIGQHHVTTRLFKAQSEAMGIPFNNMKKGHERYMVQYEQSKLSLFHEMMLHHFSALSPEQKRSENDISKQSDIYSVGVVIYFLLMGSYPEGYFELPSTRIRDQIFNWDLFIQKTLAFSPSKRAQSLRQLIQECSALQEKREESKQAEVFIPQIQFSQAQLQTIEPLDTVKEAKIEPQTKNVKEYQLIRPDTSHIQPILTDMAQIPAGNYYRGSNNGSRDEMPRHKVHIRSFLIDVHPVTNEQFLKFLEFLTGEKDAHNHDIIRIRDSRIKRSAGRLSIESGYAKHPVVGVTWYGALAYAKWIGKRLPTEAEWEIACSGGIENPLYPTGDVIEKSQANFFSSDTTNVMSYPPNGYNIYDMAGNVYEWCHDWYGYNYYEISAQEPDNPKGPLQGVYRVLRGGCWKSLQEDLRVSKRHRNNPGAANGTYGFRCAKNVEA